MATTKMTKIMLLKATSTTPITTIKARYPPSSVVFNRKSGELKVALNDRKLKKYSAIK